MRTSCMFAIGGFVFGVTSGIASLAGYCLTGTAILVAAVALITCAAFWE